MKFVNSLEKNLNKNNLIINYSNEIINKNNVINIIPSYLFSDKYLKLESMPKTPLKSYNDMPIIYTSGDEKPYVKKMDKCIVTNIDIIQSSFFMLTRYEEVLLWDKIDKDLYGRFPAKESLAYKEGFLDFPIVNEYIEWLWEWIDYFNLGYKRKNVWGKHNFAACLTHDVDNPFKYIYSLKSDMKSLKNKKTILAYRDIFLHTLSNINYKKDPFYTFDYIRRIEKKYNFTSSFYFMAGGKTDYENFYKIDDVKIAKLIDRLNQDKCEVGYHYSFNSFINFNERKIEKELLDKYIINKVYGGRNHYLRFKAPESWKISEEVGLLYDTTLSYAERIGFRCGICTPYKVFDVIQNKELNLWEIPLIVMEGSLKDKRYMNLNCDKALDEIKEKIDIVKKYRGVFTLLWHNSSFDKEGWKGWKKVFENTMRYLHKSNALGVSGREIINILNGKGD
ncbi:polysaccharide deacetylase family protein [Clostridium sp. ZS2-4]|uniref:polysaccharide deacetylase family protein n=1 Tax=Clostridium sp. ZS2-4 TaxID=2987703 RepID=UPI00227B63BC|nr:polysaccharide deacetylase family protein [Clostridium sp. ZS2-4]MCY6353982.1 polysaccharide deacetylase family protein [Clostridium sp. ZS2-4]